MFFDGNHTYTIEPGGQGSHHVSVRKGATTNTQTNQKTRQQMEGSVIFAQQAVVIADFRVFDGVTASSQDRVGYGSEDERWPLPFNEIRVHASQDRDFVDYKV